MSESDSSGSLYFYLKNGRAQGPVEKTELENSIRLGQLTPLDIAYKESDKKWKPLSEFSEFSDLFRDADGHREKQLTEEHWVLLRNKKNKGGSASFLQEGPYPSSVIKDLLQSGKISYRDYVWKEGMKDWSFIADVEVFVSAEQKKRSSRFSDPIEDIDVPKVNLSEALRSAVEVSSLKNGLKEQIPVEVEPTDLTTSTTAVSRPKIRKPRRRQGESPIAKARKKQKQSKPVAVREGSFRDEISAIFRGEKQFRWKRAVFWVGSVLIFIGTTVGVIWVANRPDPQVIQEHLQGALDGVTETVGEYLPEQDPPPQSSAPAKTSSTSKQQPAADNTRKKTEQKQKEHAVKKVVEKKPPPPPKVEPTWVKVQGLGLKGSRPRLRFQSNASHHFLFTAILRSGAGENVEGRGYYRVLKMQWNPGEKRELELRKLGLKNGFYYLQAEVEGHKAEKNFFLGTQNREYKRQVAQGKKSVTYWHQIERRKLLTLSEALKKLSDELTQIRTKWQKSPAEWSKAYTPWRKKIAEVSDGELRRLDERYPRNYVWPRHWLALANSKSQLKELGENYNREIVKGEPAMDLPFHPTELIAFLARQKEDMASLSLF